MEYQYKLNLPPLEDVLTCSPADIVKFTGRSSYTIHTPKEFFKPDWINYKNINWDFFNLFYKGDNFRGIIHSDTQHHICAWGINWITGGSGILEYWSMDEIRHKGRFTNNMHGKPVIEFNISDTPDKTYSQISGNAYLVNTYHPHRATGYGNRYALSLRSSTDSSLWEEIVDKFKDVIE